MPKRGYKPRAPRRELAIIILREPGECWLCLAATDRAIVNKQNRSLIEVCESCIGTCGIKLPEDPEFIIKE